MLAQLLTRPCVLTRELPSGATDAYGNEIPTEDYIETVCELQQVVRDERALEGELSSTLWLLLLPAGTELTTADSVEVDGKRYELFGDPAKVWNPRQQAVSHVEATLRRVAGAEDAS